MAHVCVKSRIGKGRYRANITVILASAGDSFKAIHFVDSILPFIVSLSLSLSLSLSRIKLFDTRIGGRKKKERENEEEVNERTNCLLSNEERG